MQRAGIRKGDSLQANMEECGLHCLYCKVAVAIAVRSCKWGRVVSGSGSIRQWMLLGKSAAFGRGPCILLSIWGSVVSRIGAEQNGGRGLWSAPIGPTECFFPVAAPNRWTTPASRLCCHLHQPSCNSTKARLDFVPRF